MTNDKTFTIFIAQPYAYARSGKLSKIDLYITRGCDYELLYTYQDVRLFTGKTYTFRFCLDGSDVSLVTRDMCLAIGAQIVRLNDKAPLPETCRHIFIVAANHA